MLYVFILITAKLFTRIKFQWSKEKPNRVRPSAVRGRRKSNKPNNKLRPERSQNQYNQENESISADNGVVSPSCSDVPIQHGQKRISRHAETLFVEPQSIQQRRPSHKSHQQRRSSRKSEVTTLLLTF